jgi:hypothetical protein
MEKAAKPKDRPILKVDVNEQFAWLRVLTALAWGNQPRRMDQVLATVASVGLGAMKKLKEHPDRVTDLQSLSRACGLPVGQLVRMPGTRAFYRSYFGNPEHIEHLLRRNVFDPAGHYDTVAEAPGIDALLEDMQHAISRGAYLAGVLLWLVAILHHWHRDIPASLNRAVAIIPASTSRGLIEPPSDRTILQAWKDWRHLAPLWAAYAVELRRLHGQGLILDAAGLETVHGPDALRRILSNAKWFTFFAETFSPMRAKEPLIPRGLALSIIADIEPAKPMLDRLTDRELGAATAYKAPTRKFF